MYINRVVFKNQESARFKTDEPFKVGENNRLITVYDMDREKFVNFETDHVKEISSTQVLSSKDL